jgi:glycopeptide antibiotics resistance protein
MNARASGPDDIARACRLLWLASMLFVIYASTIPFSFAGSAALVRAHVAEAVHSALSSPAHLSKADIVQNILLFVPIGVLGAGAFHPRRLTGVLIAIAAAVTLSVACESLQLLTIDRLTSAWDVGANATGAIVGAMLWPVVYPLGVRVFHTRPESEVAWSRAFLFGCAIALVGIAACEPFDITLDVGTVWVKVKPFVTNGILQWQPLSDELLTTVRFAILSFLTFEWLQSTTKRRQQTLAAVSCLLLAIGLELTQFLITSRTPLVQDVLAGAAGSLAGVFVVPALLRTMSAATLVTTATTIAALPFYLQPFVLSPHYRSIALLPFFGYYQFTSMQTVSHVIELLLIYAPVAFTFVWSRGPASTRRAILMVGIVAAVLELAQGGIAGRYPDVTDIGVAILGAAAAAAMAARGWRLRR